MRSLTAVPRRTAGLLAAISVLLLGAAPATAAEGLTRTGTINGARYVIDVPANWNGTLLLYSHGYRDAFTGSRAAQNASTPAVGQALLAKGYALAGSSFASNGWAVADGIRAAEDLLAYFRSSISKPKRVYAWGDSLGGLITQAFAEKHPTRVHGVAPLCAPLAGTNRNFDLGLDAAVALRRLIYPKLRLSGFSSYAQAKAHYDAAFAAVLKATETPGGIARLLAIAAMTDAPTKTRTFDGSDRASQVGGVVESVANVLYYGTIARYELERRVGSTFSSNVGVNYRHRISTADRNRWQAFGFQPSLLDTVVGSVQVFGVRVSARSTSRTRAARFATPTGDLTRRTLTLHTRFDPLVLVQNERVFAQRVSAHGDSAKLAQFYTGPPATYSEDSGAPYGAGHCNFTTDERLGVITALDRWVKTGVRPTAASLRAAMGGSPGLLERYTPPAWPAR